MKKDKSCGGIVYIKQNCSILFLLIKQKRHNDWVFPKGHVECGETEIDTALREIKEETGLDVNIINGFRYTVNYIVNGDINKDVVYFLAYPKNMDVICQDEEVKDFKWLDYQDAVRQLSYENLQNALKSAYSYMKEHNL